MLQRNKCTEPEINLSCESIGRNMIQEERNHMDSLIDAARTALFEVGSLDQAESAFKAMMDSFDSSGFKTTFNEYLKLHRQDLLKG